jgi:NhaP-type Na+/H+ or K+/H+ antiporter
MGPPHRYLSSAAAGCGTPLAREEDYDATHGGFFVFVSLLCGVVSEIIRKRVRLPYTVVLILVGALLGIMNHNFSLGPLSGSIGKWTSLDPHVILYIMLPPLIYEGTSDVDHHAFMKALYSMLTLAGPGVLVSTFLVASLAKLVGHYEWDWYACGAFGAMMSATDPVAVVALMKELGAPQHLAILIEGESLFNDGTAMVVFLICVDLMEKNACLVLPHEAESNPHFNHTCTGEHAHLEDQLCHSCAWFQCEPCEGEDLSPVNFLLAVARMAFGGALVGYIMGKLMTRSLNLLIDHAEMEICLTIAASYGAYFVAEGTVLKMSGVLSVVMVGLEMAGNKNSVSPTIEHFMHQFWGMMAHVANTLVFVMSGVLCAEKCLYTETIGAKDFGLLVLLYIALHMVRATVILLFSPALRVMGYGLGTAEATVLAWAGLRGSIGLCLGLMVSSNPKFDDKLKDRFMFHTSGIVFFTLVINGTTIKRLLRGLALTKESYASTQLFMTAMHGLTKDTIQNLVQLRENAIYAYADWDAVLSFMPPFFDLDTSNTDTKSGSANMGLQAYSLKGALEQEQQAMQHKGKQKLFKSRKRAQKIARKKSQALRQQLGSTADDSLNKLVRASIAMSDRGELNDQLITKMTDRFLPEAWLRYFSLVRSSYRHLFEDVPCGPTAMRQLFEAISCVEDDVGKSRQELGDFKVDEWSYLQSHVKLPNAVTKAGDSLCFGLISSVSKVLLQKGLSHAFDVSSAFARVHREVNTTFVETVLQAMLEVEIDDLVHVSSDAPSIETQAIKIVRQRHMTAVIGLIKQTVIKSTSTWIAAAEEVVNDVQDAFPDAACSVVTRQATFALLRQTAKAVTELKQAGKFKTKEYDLITGELLRCRKKLVFKPPQITAETAEQVLRRSLLFEGFVARQQEEGVLDRSLVHMDEEFFIGLLKEGKEVVRNRGQFLYRKGDDAPGFYIVLRGCIRYLHPDYDTSSSTPRGQTVTQSALEVDGNGEALPHTTGKYGYVGHLELLLAEMHSSYGNQQSVSNGSPYEAWKKDSAPKQARRLLSAQCTSMVHAFFFPTSAYASLLNHVDNSCPRFRSYLKKEEANDARQILWRTASIPLMFIHFSAIPGVPPWNERSDQSAAAMEAACEEVSIKKIPDAQPDWSRTVQLIGPALKLTGHMFDSVAGVWPHVNPCEVVGLEFDPEGQNVSKFTVSSWYLEIPYKSFLEAHDSAMKRILRQHRDKETMNKTVDTWQAASPQNPTPRGPSSKHWIGIAAKTVAQQPNGATTHEIANDAMTRAIGYDAMTHAIDYDAPAGAASTSDDLAAMLQASAPITSNAANPGTALMSAPGNTAAIPLEALYGSSREDIKAMDLQKIML